MRLVSKNNSVTCGGYWNISINTYNDIINTRDDIISTRCSSAMANSDIIATRCHTTECIIPHGYTVVSSGTSGQGELSYGLIK